MGVGPRRQAVVPGTDERVIKFVGEFSAESAKLQGLLLHGLCDLLLCVYDPELLALELVFVWVVRSGAQGPQFSELALTDHWVWGLSVFEITSQMPVFGESAGVLIVVRTVTTGIGIG